MTPYFASVRFTRANGPEYYPALISFTAKDFRDAGDTLFGFIAGFELSRLGTIAVEEISVNRPRGIQPPVVVGQPLNDPGLEQFLFGGK